MLLALDATRFGYGLEEAVRLAAGRKISALEYTFQPFKASSRGSGQLSGRERRHLRSVRELAAASGVEVSCLNLEYCLDARAKKSVADFRAMIGKLSLVAAELAAKRLTFVLDCRGGEEQAAALEAAAQPAIDRCAALGVKLLLRLDTPAGYRRTSLGRWAPLSPLVWRDILSSCPGLSLSFSPADCAWQGIDYLKLLPQFMPAIEQVMANDVEINRELISQNGLFGPLWWRYRLPGRGQIDWRQLVEALKLYDFTGSFSIRLDDEFVGDDPAELPLALDASMAVLAPLVRG